MADILIARDLKNAMALYNQFLQEQGAESAAAKDMYAQQQRVLSEYGNGNVDVEPAAFRDFVEYLKIFGGSFDESSNEFKWTPAGERAMSRFEPDLTKLEAAVREAEMQKQAAAQENGDNSIPAQPSILPENNQKSVQPIPETDPTEQTVSLEEIQKIRDDMEQFRLRSPYSDRNQYVLDRVAMDVYLDMGIINADQHAKSSEGETIEVLNSIPDLQGEQAKEFSERFIDRIAGNQELFDMAPPATLAYAYIGTKERIADENGDKSTFVARLEKLSARIDELTANFATNSAYYFADPTNIADVYDGYNKMFDARRGDLDSEKDATKIQQIDQNKEKLENFIREYDERWGLSGVSPEDAPKLEKRWADLVKRVGAVKISDETMKLASKYKFLDANGNLIPQFIDAKGNATANYAKGNKIDTNGRLNRVIDLARHDIAMQNVAKVNDKIDDAKLESDINDRIPFKLFEIDTADKVMQGAMENPEQFTDPKYLEKFVADLGDGKGEISNNGYEAAMDAQVNQTGGFAQRLKSKLKDGAKKVGGFFGKLFKPISDIDKRKDARVSGGNPGADKRQKRIDFFVRILKGFGSAFLVSAAITTIATAAAATAGISVAVSIAAIGIITGIVMGAVQINKWKKRQQAAGQPADIKAFLKDKRMLATLGTTALASVAMIFGAAGLSSAAMALGYGAMALGGSNNAIAMYKDAKRSGMSTAESLTWSIANAAAIIGGGFAGRFTARAGIQAFNESHPENTVFQTKEVTQGTHQVERQETHTVYNDNALHNAEHIAKMWYADNPTELQHRVDLINDYNTAHGTTIDPYRAVMLNADAGGHTFDNMALHVDGGGHIYSGGHHTVLTAQWGAEHGVNGSDLHALQHMFAADGSLNPDGVRVAMNVDPMISATNEVGVVSSGDAPHYDGVLHQNTVDAHGTPVYNTYADGDSVFHSETHTVIDNVPVDVTTYTPVDVPYGLGMFGISYPRTKADFQKMQDRVGALLDKIGENKIEPKPRPRPKPGVEVVEPEVIDDDQKLLPAHDKQKVLPEHKKQLALPEGDKIKGLLPEHIDVLPGHTDESKRKPTIQHVEQKLLSEHIEEPKHILNITYAQAKNLDLLPKQIADIEQKRQKPGLKKAEADKLLAKQKDLQQKLQTLINQLGRPDDETLDIAKSDAYRRNDLQQTIDALGNIQTQVIGYEAHQDNRSKYDFDILRQQESELWSKIEQLGGIESLQDTSYLYNPEQFKPDYKKSGKQDKVDKKENKNKFSKGSEKVNEKRDARDTKNQEKLRRKRDQQLVQTKLKQY